MNKSFTAKRKLWKVMKICAAQGMIAILICGMAIAHDDHAQLLEKKIVVNVKDVSLKVALKEIGAAGDVKISYRNDQYKDELNQKVSVESNGRSLGDVLDLLLAPYKIKYKVIEKRQSIVLELRGREQAVDEQDDEPAPDLKTEIRLPMVTGTVIDAVTQQPMTGVNVLIKGTTRGTTTDVNGVFTLEAGENEVIVFSFIGYASFETKTGNRNVIDVVLQEDAKNLDEVVINQGYWEVNEKEQTGNVSRVTSKEIQNQNVSNPLQALQGRMAGVYIQQNTGIPGGSINIQIRGQNSLRNGTDGNVNGNLPLYLIDGVPFTSTSLTSPSISGGNLGGGNPLSTINPNDIESIEILKDADATAIYGSRGANGVVLITTKKGKGGKSKLTADVYHGIGQVSSSLNLLTTSQYLQVRKEAFKNDAIAPNLLRAPDLVAWDTTRSTNWQKELIGGTGHITNAQLSFSGGTAKTQFLFGGGFYRESTVFPGDGSFQRGSGHLSVNHASEDNRFKLSSSVSYSSSVTDIPTIDFTAQAVTLAPNSPKLLDENGALNWENNTWINPLSFLERKYSSSIENFVSNASLSFEILPGLNIKSSLGYTSMTVGEIRTNPLTAYSPQDLIGRTGSSSFGDSYVKTWIIEPQIDYTRKIKGGTLTALIGTTFQESLQAGRALEATGYSNDAFLKNISAATTIKVSENTYSQYRYTAAFGRINYNWQEKYIINLTGRRDGSSRFGPGNRFANFGAVGAAWIFSNEKFAGDNVGFLSFGKIRASYGITGSDAIGNYQYLETYSATRYPYAGTSGLSLTRLANADYSWETNKKFEAGIDLGIFKSKINFSASFYLNHSTGQLVGLPLPVITGQSSVQFNLPATVENRGWEFLVSSVNLKTERLQWSTIFNITLPSNKLVEFPEIEKFPVYAARYDVGNSIYTYKGYQYNKVNPQTGLYTFIDKDGDGIISSPNDYTGLKKITQDFYGGIGNSLKYRNIQLEIFFQFVNQTGYNYQRSFALAGTLSNQPFIVMNRWQTTGNEATLQRFTALDPTGQVSIGNTNNLFSDNIVTDASFVRLKNIAISWQLPLNWIQKVKMQAARVYVQGQNLLTFTDYLGLDPENQTSLSLPPLRVLTAGISITL